DGSARFHGHDGRPTIRWRRHGHHLLRSGNGRDLKGRRFSLGLHVGKQLAGLLGHRDRKSTRLNSSHVKISYAVFCLKKKTKWMVRTRLAEYYPHQVIGTTFTPKSAARLKNRAGQRGAETSADTRRHPQLHSARLTAK